jgi:methionyl-tRNA formyltransferase
LSPSPVKIVATEHGIPVIQPPSLKGGLAQKELANLNADLMVVVAYGLILPESILQTPRYGCINVHASLLPRWRGAAPVERAILAGDKETGVTIMQMDAGLDTGDMLRKIPVTIEETDTRVSIEDKLVDAGIKALVVVLDNFAEFQNEAMPQDNSLSTYADKVSKEEAIIEWQSDAGMIIRQLKAGIGRYPAYSYIDGIRVRFLGGRAQNSHHNSTPGTILELDKDSLIIACGKGTVAVSLLQLPGKTPINIVDLVNSNQAAFSQGARFTPLEADD